MNSHDSNLQPANMSELVSDTTQTKIIYVDAGDISLQMLSQGQEQQYVPQQRTTMIVTESGLAPAPGNILMEINRAEEGDQQEVSADPVAESSLASEQPDTEASQSVEEAPDQTEVPKKASPQPDLTQPITLTDETVVVINGKKCVLRVEANSGQLCAFPVQTAVGKRKVGRPRKPKPDPNAPVQTPVKPSGTEEEEGVSTPSDRSAAEGLLELSNTDGLRRSARKRKKRGFGDYANPDNVSDLEGDDNEEGGDDEDDADFHAEKKARGRPPLKKEDGTPGNPPVKRGRGRPRRYPRPDETPAAPSPEKPVKHPGPIPAFIIPTSDGQTVMMAPIEGIQTLQAYQQSTTKPNPDNLAESEVQEEAAEGTEEKRAESAEQAEGDKEVKNEGEDEAAENEEEEEEEDEEDLGEEDEGVLDDTTTQEADDAEQTTPVAAVQGKKRRGRKPGWAKAVANKLGGPSTVIQLPDNIFPMLVAKQSPKPAPETTSPVQQPIKIGLKATESELSKFKCPKCDYQAYYLNQYQDHIGTHAEAIHKCKCCSYLSFEESDVVEHFKAAHPKNYCDVCGLMAEHAYIIKRHKMRHNSGGCECGVCGKKYKDQYILKMHIKMVHMPAEVLYECSVCAKKFTRKAHLKRHLRIHDPEKPFKCPQCDYRGCERSDITKHLLIHEEPRYECEVCSKPFRHAKNKELHVKRHKGQRDYKCGVCDFYGYTFTDIRKHIERKHSQPHATVIGCEKCGAHFKSHAMLAEHVKICDLTLIEQALAVTSEGTQQTVQITTDIDGTPHLTIDGTQVNIVEADITAEDSEIAEISLTEEQLAQAQIAVSQAQAGTEIELDQVEHVETDQDGIRQVTAELHVPPEVMHLNVD